MLFRIRFLLPLGLIACGLIANLNADIPANYWDSADTTNAATLRSSVNDIITAGFSEVNFDNSTASFGALARTDLDHGDDTLVRLIYSGDSRPIERDTPGSQDGDPALGDWNREHAFPQSFFNSDSPMVSDLHALFPSDEDINSRRSNSEYDNVASPTEIDVFGNRSTTSVFEPQDSMKGDAARAILYMDVRYEGEAGEPNLTIAETLPGSPTGGNAMAVLSTLLQWHNLDPVDSFEVIRNNRVFDEQGNANPFVANPEWVQIVYGSAAPVVANGDALGGLTFADRAPAMANAGDGDVPFLSLDFSLSANEYDVGELDVQQIGTAGDGDIDNVRLWFDRDGSGSVNAEDVLLAESALSGGTATLRAFAPHRLNAGDSVNLLVTASIAVTATDGATVRLRAVGNGLRHDARGGADVDPPFANWDSGAAMIGGLQGVTSVWINEFHYDNVGGDLNEFVEVAGTAGVDLSGWTLVGYNGNGGAMYQTINLSGTIPDQANGFGTLGFDFTGLQNGGPDGIALVNDANEVIQFLSYEGAFTAADGPAAGQMSIDVGVSEDSSTLEAESLQLTGTGSAASDFEWQPPMANTRGQPNTGQNFLSGVEENAASLWLDYE